MISEKNEAVRRFWERCRKEHGIGETGWFASTFADPNLATYHDELLGLVSQGRKRATAHLAMDFERNRIRRREAGDYWLILDSDKAPRFLLRITEVEVFPFDRVPERIAIREGEGDSSLEYWRAVHREYFQLQCTAWRVEWREDFDTVCESFEVVAEHEEDGAGISAR